MILEGESLTLSDRRIGTCQMPWIKTMAIRVPKRKDGNMCRVRHKWFIGYQRVREEGGGRWR